MVSKIYIYIYSTLLQLIQKTYWCILMLSDSGYINGYIRQSWILSLLCMKRRVMQPTVFNLTCIRKLNRLTGNYFPAYFNNLPLVCLNVSVLVCDCPLLWLHNRHLIYYMLLRHNKFIQLLYSTMQFLKDSSTVRCILEWFLKVCVSTVFVF